MVCRILRSTLVCDSVPEAKRIAFMGPERHKVVALDGTLIGKQGFITGGMSGNEAARASRWNDSALEGLKEVGLCCYATVSLGRLPSESVSRKLLVTHRASL